MTFGQIDYLVMCMRRDWFLNIKLAEVSVREESLKYLGIWNPISQRFLSRVKGLCSKSSNSLYSSNSSIQIACKLISANSKEIP